MISAIIIFAITSILLILSILFLPKIRIKKFQISTYWIIVLIGAIFVIAFRCVGIREIGEIFISNSSSNPLKILVLFFSMTFLSIFLDEVGVFSFLAKKAASVVKHSQYKLFLILYILVSVLTVFTSNDIVILTFTPFIIYFSKHSKVNPIPYLVGEFVAANTWSMMLLIGNPTNIYLGMNANIDFVNYFLVMAIPTLISGLFELGLLFLLFRKKLKQNIEVVDCEFNKLNKLDVFVGVLHLILCLIFLIISNYIKIEMYIFCLIFMISEIIYLVWISIYRGDKLKILRNILKRLPYALIPFVISMFVMVLALTNSGVSEEIGKLLSGNFELFTFGCSSFLMCNLMNNIPMSILYSTFASSKEAIYASIIGSNIGAFLTPIGALAGIMFTSLLAKQKVKYSFFDFSKYGAIISIPTITVALLVLKLILVI